MNEKAQTTATCHACGTTFQPRISYQLERRSDGSVRAFCSLPCKAGASAAGSNTCNTCGKSFVLTFAYQAARQPDGSVRYACSEACRHATAQRSAVAPAPAVETTAAATTKPRAYRVAVLNQKGGTGKTTTSINLAAGFAEAGHRVLLIDCDPQGNVGVSLGVKGEKSLYHLLMDQAALEDVAVPISNNLDVVTSDDTLAAAEIKLAQHPGRGAVLSRRLEGAPYTHIILDCGPSLSLINQNALCAVDEVLVPVACDYLSLVGVKQVLKTVKNINQHLGHPLRVGAVLPTFYDSRAKICRDALDALRKHFGDLCLPPVRMNTKLKEAPSHKKTIFEHDPTCTGAEDYRLCVDWMLRRSAEHVHGAVATQKAPTTPAQGTPLSPQLETLKHKAVPAPVELALDAALETTQVYATVRSRA